MPWTPIVPSNVPGWAPLGSGPAGLWGSISTSQTPNWTGIASALSGAYQFGAYQGDGVTSFAYQTITISAAWTPVNDGQTGSWTPVP